MSEQTHLTVGWAFLLKKGGVEFSGNPVVQEVRTAFSLRPMSYKIFPADTEQVLTILERNSVTRYPGQEWGL